MNIVNEYNSFNLANVTAPVAPKWKTSETLLDDYHIFQCSCQRIFDGAMCHITSSKVKTGVFLMWAGLDGEDIYDSFNLLPAWKYDINFILDRFEELKQFATLEWLDLSLLRYTKIRVGLLVPFAIEFSRLDINVNFQI